MLDYLTVDLGRLSMSLTKDISVHCNKYIIAGIVSYRETFSSLQNYIHLVNSACFKSLPNCNPRTLLPNINTHIKFVENR